MGAAVRRTRSTSDFGSGRARESSAGAWLLQPLDRGGHFDVEVSLHSAYGPLRVKCRAVRAPSYFSAIFSRCRGMRPAGPLPLFFFFCETTAKMSRRAKK